MKIGEEAVGSGDGLLFRCQYLLRSVIKNALQYCVNYGNIFLYHSVRLFGSSLKRNSHSLINLEYSKKGILPVKHDFVNLGQAAVWENPPQTKEEALEAFKAVSAALFMLQRAGNRMEGGFPGFLPGEKISAAHL